MFLTLDVMLLRRKIKNRLRKHMNPKKFRQKIAFREEKNDQNRDIDFIGSYYPNKENWKTKGFFNLFHGIKETEQNTIETLVKIAEDGQAIYEFLQNAVDANASKFYIFYDENYFLAINNGDKFLEKDVESLLNVAQSTKTDQEKKIGKFGVGFKLIHRLVGRSSGINEIVNEYKGPILFSWDNNTFTKIFSENFSDIDNQWLLKIIYTNFPCGLEETVKGKSYEEIKPFSLSDFNEMVTFIKLQSQKINKDITNKGSLFFLKLGHKKFDLLEKENEDLNLGVGVSLNILNSIRGAKKGIDTVVINNNRISKEKLQIINDENYMLLYPTLDESINYYKQDVSKKISFYRFFPMGDQVNNLNFVIHHYLFEVETNRRKLQDNIENKKIFNHIWIKVNIELEELKRKDDFRFIEILANFYLSDLDSANGNSFITENFTNKIYEYIKENIPTLNNLNNIEVSNSNQDVIIVDSKLRIPLSKHKEFYFSHNLNYREITSQAKKKLNLKKLNLIDLIIDDDIHNWILNLEHKELEVLLSEIKGTLNKDKNVIQSFNKEYNLNEIKIVLKIFSKLNTNNIKFAIVKNKTNYSILLNSENTLIRNRNLRDFLDSTYELAEIEYYLIPEELENELNAIVKYKEKDQILIKDFLQRGQHKEFIGFINNEDLKLHFLKTLDRVQLYSNKPFKDSYENIILNFALDVLENKNDLDDFRKKLYINDTNVMHLTKSPFITFTYGSKVSNPKSWDNHIDRNIVQYIDSLDDKLKGLFNIQEDSKNDIFNFIKSELINKNNIINTFNRLKFIILYSLEIEENLLSDFNGVKILNKNGEIDSFSSVYKIFTKDLFLPSDKLEILNIFNISDFFPNELQSEYYLLDKEYSIQEEQLPKELKKSYIETFKKIGLNIDENLLKLRKELINDKEINSDELSKLSQNQLVNTLGFISNKNKIYILDDKKAENIKKIFKKIDNANKESLKFNPVLIGIDSFQIFQTNKYLYNKKFITKERLKSENKIFKNRLINMINNEEIIYLDIMDFEVSEDKIITENNDDKLYEKKEKLATRDAEISLKANSSNAEATDYNWMIGWKGEKYVYELLLKHLEVDNVIWYNEDATCLAEDKGGIDIVILNDHEIIHRIEVKTTIKSLNAEDNVQFNMSNKQFEAAMNWGKDTHLVFVTGIEDQNPKHLYFNFNDNWLNSLSNRM